MPEAITEEQGVHEQWYEEAAKVTPETLPAFIEKLTTKYRHDYGTICHAVAASALAAAYATNRSPGGGITGFQAGCVMWEFVQRWLHLDGPLRLVQYDDMLFPQHAEKFEKTISPDVAKRLQTRAQELIDENTHGDEVKAHPNVYAHWKKLAAGELPFGYTVRDDA